MKQTHDAIVIGTGQAGPALAVRLAHAGRRLRMVEREHFGGTCVNDGCMPTKTLVASARAAHIARRAAEYGVTLGGPVSVDMKAVKARKDRVVAQSIDGLTQVAQGDWRTSRSCSGHARFVGPHAVEVGGRAARGARNLHQRRRPRHAARLAGDRRRDGADQRVDDGARHPARAPDRRRRQLHRARVRANVPTLRLAA